MFSGLMSRWTMPSLEALQRAAVTCRRISSVSCGERAAAAGDFAQIAAGHVFLHDVVDALVLADFVDLHDAGMHQCGGGAGFVMKPADIVRIAGQLFVEHLERDLPAERKLLGQIDLGHRPAAKPAEDVEVFQLFCQRGRPLDGS